MKRHTNFLHTLCTGTLISFGAVLLTACTADPVLQEEGSIPENSGNTAGTLVSTVKQAVGEVALSLQFDASKESGNELSDAFAYQLAAAVDHDVTIRFRIDTLLVKSYNDERRFENLWDFDNGRYKTCQRLRAIHPDDVKFSADGTMSIPTGKTQSAPVSITFNFDQTRDSREAPANGVSYMPLQKFGQYLCPIVAEQLAADGSVVRTETLWYKINLVKDISHWALSIPQRKKDYPQALMIAVYCNTALLAPSIVNKICGIVTDTNTWAEQGPYYMCDIENLETATVTYNAKQQRAVLSLHSDLRYVLDHRSKYIAPVQAVGTKVCIVIQGGEQGIGFCNLNDAQRTDLAAQIRNVVMNYNLDGVNLWDKNSGYGAAGMPAVNNTSYPKFIKALRDALGPDKMLTLVDEGEPTAGMSQAVEGIEVGKLIDYAFSGYIWEPVNPWGTNKFGRKPIAGLDRTRYSSQMLDWSGYNPMEDTEKWGTDDLFGSTWAPVSIEAAKATGPIITAYGMIASIHGTRNEGQPSKLLGESIYIYFSPDLNPVEFTGNFWNTMNTNMVLTDENHQSHSDGLKDW